MPAATPHPKRLAQYEVIETLASTGKVHIYRAIDSSLQRTVTLKTVAKDIRDNETAVIVGRFKNQAQTSSYLNHPGIVSVYEYGEDGPSAFLALEHVEGCTLKERIRVPIKDAGSIIVQLLTALSYAHEQGVVHGDIKPANLVLTSKGQLRITDFGCADSHAAAGPYVSPEQLKGLAADYRSDIFSSGVFLYELLTGTNPFAGPAETLIQRVGNDKERSVSEVNSSVPQVFDSVCGRALAKEPESRYETAQRFAEAVSTAFENAYGAPPRDLVSNETVVSIFLSSLRGQSRARSTPKPMPPKVEVQSPPANFASQWDAAVLRTVERQLAAFIGPLARMVVKDVAGKTTELDELYSLAAESLERDEDRRLFLAARDTFNRDKAAGKPLFAPQPSDSSESETATLLGPELSLKPELSPASNAVPAVPSQVESAPINDVESSGKKYETGPANVSSSAFAESLGGGKKGVVEEPESRLRAEPVSPRPDQAKPADHALAMSPGKGARERGRHDEDTDLASRLEEVLGKQPENLAGYLREEPPEVDEMIHAFVATVEALVTMLAANGKLQALVPQNICFDRMGKVTVQSSQTTLTQSTSVSGVGSPRYAAPEIFAEDGTADPTGVATSVYALGFMFYEISLGTKLFRKTFAAQNTELDWLRWHADRRSKAPSLKVLVSDRPAALSDLLDGMIEKNAETRTTDLQTIVARLRVIAQQANRTIIRKKPAAAIPKSLANAPAAGKIKGPGKRVLMIAIVLLALAVAAILGLINPGLHRLLTAPFHHHEQTTEQPSTR